ncbi:uncharacterized protein LOC102444539 isoform X2 [Pelodiscus sinensis]|uniref:uncharacterized protein LOC102444539 isoform X2 n=1 Tax=Pelodiscus sinensis TaxID=13735 RepID=UPI003F6CD8D6
MVGYIPIAIGAVAGLGVATVAVPAVLGVAGFSSAGIAAGSVGAKMMSAAAVANGGGVAAGSTVAVLQSIDAYRPRYASDLVLPIIPSSGPRCW